MRRSSALAPAATSPQRASNARVPSGGAGDQLPECGLLADRRSPSERLVSHIGVAGRGELYAMNVHLDHWREGVGSALLNSVSEQLVEMELPDALLWTGKQTSRAKLFHFAHGWQLEGITRVEHVHGLAVAEVRLAKHRERGLLARSADVPGRSALLAGGPMTGIPTLPRRSCRCRRLLRRSPV